MTRRILAVLESRATYGYSRNVMREIQKHSELELTTLVTGGHLIPSIGGDVSLIERDGFDITNQVSFDPVGRGKAAWSKAMGSAIMNYSETIARISPDLVLLFGDRIETLSVCITCAYMNIPIAHVQAGDKSGHIDDCARYAIAKFAHIHFASCNDSADRLRRLGEEDYRIHNTGAPQLDDIYLNTDKESVTINNSTFSLLDEFCIFLYHPLMSCVEDTAKLTRNALRAVLESGLRVLWINPNNDLGYQGVLDVMEEYASSSNITFAPNLDRDDFLACLRKAKVLVGNSSSGILEAPSFGTPVINIGDRQRGRPQAINIFNSEPGYIDIHNQLRNLLTNEELMKQCRTSVNLYGDGNSSKRICKILKEVSLDSYLLDKQTVY